MLSTWVSLGLLILGAEAVPGGNDHKEYQPHTEVKTISVTHYVDVTIPHYITKTSTALTTTTLCFTESTTSTLHFTEYTTSTLHYTESTTSTLHFQESTTTSLYFKESTTSTHHFTVTSTETDTVSTTITNTATVSTTITNTETSTITQTSTVIFTTFDPCPTTCTVSANTVTVFFWPTDRPYSYPTTYVHPTLDYTFTSPSVYMLIDTVRGTNTLGQPAGPSTASWMLALDLEDVSTIESGTLTRQLTLSDLGTDCPQTADPTAIATLLNDSRCNPILAAPTQVRSWAYPCNACGRFGLFDPPYAVPTVTGGLVVSTPPPPPVGTTAPPVPTTTPAPPSATTTARVSPVPVPASATKTSAGLLWAISAVLATVFFL